MSQVFRKLENYKEILILLKIHLNKIKKKPILNFRKDQKIKCTKNYIILKHVILNTYIIYTILYLIL